MKIKSLSIIGSGIVGLVTATMIKQMVPELDINIFDAGGDPRKSSVVGTTFGQGRDARHFSGSESLSFQNPIHARAMRLYPGQSKKWAGWRLIPESELTTNERRWRSNSTHRFVDIGHENLNFYDDLHAQFNYAGIGLWKVLGKQHKYISKYKISDGPMSVYFLTKNNFDDDVISETDFLQQFGPESGQVKVLKGTNYSVHFKKLAKKKYIFPKALQLPGASWRIRSLGLKLIDDLENQGVIFHWNKEINDTDKLNDEVVIWTVGTTHKVPEIYKKHTLIQGIAGCWITIPNRGFTKPFKISVPQPTGYINFTPDGEVIHISGGFGWVGERPYSEAIELMEPIIKHFKQMVSRYFGVKIKKNLPVGICIRPSSPTGLPDARTVIMNKKKNIILTGSSKSGSTQSPLLALYALSKIDKRKTKIYFKKLDNLKIGKAFNAISELNKIHRFRNSTNYPESLERDLF
jgi:hypothetical protein